jgi:hypothetical protein
MERTAGHSILDHKRNEKIMTIKVPQITEFIEQYKQHRKEHIDRMSSDAIPKQILHEPKQNRSLGRPLK